MGPDPDTSTPWGRTTVTRARGPVRASPSPTRRTVRGGEARSRTRRQPPRRLVAAGAAVAIAAGGVAFAATRSPGYPTERVIPNDGAVWVTNDRSGYFGRLSKPSASLDAAFPPVDTSVQTHQLDIFQSAGTVVARDRVAARLTPVDVRNGDLVKDQSVAVATGELVAVGGGSVATLDPQTGAVRAAWAAPDRPASVDGLSSDSKPLASVPLTPGLPQTDRGAAVAVGQDGTVFAAGSGGQLLTLRPDHGTGRFSVRTRALGSAFQDVQIATVGGEVLVVDTVGGTMVLPGGGQVDLPASADGGVLQTGPMAGSALLATPTALLSIDLGSGALTSLFDRGTGPAAAPIVVGDCGYAAWAGSPGVVVRACGGRPATTITLTDEVALLTPQLRLNRQSAVLNDGATGAVWDLDSGKRLDNWGAVIPPSSDQPNIDPSRPRTLTPSQQKPRAVDDDLGARPGRTSVLHVLDNDANPAGSVLSIREVTAPQPLTATLSIAPDGQSIQVIMQNDSRDVTFTYTVDDAKGNASSAQVVVHAHQPSENGAPVLRLGYQPDVHTVANHGRLSLPVLGDWRDPDGDPVVLAAASDGDVSVPVSADGRLQYSAPAESGSRRISYVVSDGALTADGVQTVQVLARDSTATTPPTTEPDVARGQTDSPIVIRPLDNDLPGTDPTSQSPQLALASDVVAPEGADTTSDLKAGEVTLVAGAPGTYLMTYTASYGDAPYARGTIRVDVSKPVARTDRPTAMLDQAVVYGQNATVVDVLANDFDPSGRLLAVQSATTTQAMDLKVAVIRGRWLRIQPTSPTVSPNPQRIAYTITDGVTGTVTGEVAVQQLAPPTDLTPDPTDDYATVRSGDTVAVPVLDNDIHPAGEPLTLLAQVEGAPHAGMLPVRESGGSLADVGGAYVAGRVVRYQAPIVTSRVTVAVTYVVEDPEGNRASGTAYVTVVPEPTPEHPDAAPTPPQIEGRVVAGDTMTIQVPTSEVDPDGDSVTLVGLGTAPTQGRVLGMTLSSITYQAYPSSAETDQFTYVVTDRFGKVGTATVRIAVLPPGAPQPPVAVDDFVTAAPGATLHLDILGNDIQAIGDSATVLPLGPYNPGLGARAAVDPATSMLSVTAPDDVVPLTIRYAIRGSSVATSQGAVHIRSVQGVDIPPVARNPVAEPAAGATSVDVDVLATATDPDGDGTPLTVTRVFNAPTATISGGLVTLPVGPAPQIVAYEIADDKGGVALGSIYVPGVGSGAPQVRINGLVHVDKDSSTTVSLADVVVDPSRKHVILTTDDQLSASPAGVITVEAVSEDQVKVTARKGYVGPAAIAFQVTNGSTATDPAGRLALLTVPVQVGPETPVLRCPPTDVPVVIGGRSELSIPQYCHVWTAQPQSLDALRFSGRFSGQEAGLQVTSPDPHTLVVSASGDAVPGTHAQLVVSVPGTQAAPATLTVLVSAAGPPTLAQMVLQGVHAGTPQTIDVSGHISSQLANPRLSIVGVQRVSGPEALVSRLGPTTLVVTPAATAVGRTVFDVTISDIADTSRIDRQAHNTLTLEVLGVPGAPGAPALTGDSASHQLTLAWAVPPNNGLPIDFYDVSWSGGTQRCPASPCTITGLTNGVPYTFAVVAHNGVGFGPSSPRSAPIVANAVPGLPGDPHTLHPADGSVEVAWSPAPVDGTPVTRYLVTWPGGNAETSGTNVIATGLDNSAEVTFTVKAYNDAGWGPGATTVGQSAGRPARPDAPALTPTEIGGGEQQAVGIAWVAVAPNGPGPTTYTVRRSGGPNGTVVCADIVDTTCTAPAVTTDGTVYTYSVTASNAFYASLPSPSASLVASGTPGSFSALTATATGVSHEVRLTFVSPVAHDRGLTITCDADGSPCGSWDAPAAPTAFDETITVPQNGTRPLITLTATNSSASSVATVRPDTVFGPLGAVSVTGLVGQGPYVAFTVGVDPMGLPASVTVRVIANGATVATLTDGTGPGPYSAAHEVKVGYGKNVRVIALATRSGDSTTDQATTSTGTGRVTVSSQPAGSCAPANPCDTLAVTLTVDNLAFSRQITCTIQGPAQTWGDLAFPTDSRGHATYDVPESAFTATSGTAYTVSCDDSGTPAAPATTRWTAP